MKIYKWSFLSLLREAKNNIATDFKNKQCLFALFVKKICEMRDRRMKFISFCHPISSKKQHALKRKFFTIIRMRISLYKEKQDVIQCFKRTILKRKRKQFYLCLRQKIHTKKCSNQLQSYHALVYGRTIEQVQKSYLRIWKSRVIY